MTSLAFMNVGPDTELATLMVRSVRASNPSMKIIQVTDYGSASVAGVDQVKRFDGDSSQLMTFRLVAFAAIKVEEPVWFVDTDMLCLAQLRLPNAKAGTVAVCLREFYKDSPLSVSAGGVDLSEYEGKTVGEAYPYLACVTYVHQNNFWPRCLKEPARIDPKFRYWFGDQEAMRRVVGKSPSRFANLPESAYACLPEFERDGQDIQMLHFKGGRKDLMLERAGRLGLL